MSKFNLDFFLKENNLKAIDLVNVTGYNKNTFTKWRKLTSDEKLPQDFILKLTKSYPHIELADYFPTHAEIIKLYKES